MSYFVSGQTLCNVEDKCVVFAWNDWQAVSLPAGEETVLMHVNVQQPFCTKTKKNYFLASPLLGHTELAEACM